MGSMGKKFAVIVGASALALAACSSDSDDSSGGDSGGDSVASQYDLSGVDLAIGSKDFDEQLILGQMMVQAYEAAGANVDDKVNLGGTAVAREALLSGEIDMYMEYNGTGWTVHLGQEDPSFDPEELTSGVRDLDAENGIVWVDRSPFNNTYGFASSPAATEANGGPFTLKSMMEYVRDNPDAVVCMESEFPDRPDGLILTETHAGIELPDAQQNILDTGVIYTETANDNCDFGDLHDRRPYPRIGSDLGRGSGRQHPLQHLGNHSRGDPRRERGCLRCDHGCDSRAARQPQDGRAQRSRLSRR